MQITLEWVTSVMREVVKEQKPHGWESFKASATWHIKFSAVFGSRSARPPTKRAEPSLRDSHSYKAFTFLSKL